MNIRHTVTSLFDGLINVLAFCGGAVTVGITFLVGVDVVMRYTLNSPLENVFEITEHSLVFMTFLVAPWVLRHEQHVKMEGVLSHFSPKTQAFINTMTSLLGALICLVLFWYGLQGTWDYYTRGLWFPGGMRIPQYPILSVIVVAYLLLFMQFLRRSHGYLIKWRTYGSG